MPQHLLVAHDLSPQADIALQRAALLQRRLGARLSLLHVAPGSGDAAWLHDQLQARVQALGITAAELHVRHGSASDGILCMLHALQADLLLLGAHAPDTALASSTAEQLLQACPALLLCVTPAGSDWAHALGLLDFSPCASRALRRAHSLLAADAQLTAVNVFERAAIHAQDEPAELEFQRSLFDTLLAGEQAALGQQGARLHGDWRVGELHQCLDAALQQYRPALLAVGEHHRGRLADSLLGSLAIDLLQAPPCDLLITR